jgi:histidyl-tRNA synthetase
MLAADAMEALDLQTHDNASGRGQHYVVNINNRKILDGIMDVAEIPQEKRLIVVRAIDKYDRLRIEGVHELLGKGRKDESGDFTPGADLGADQKKIILNFLEAQLADPLVADDALKGGWASPQSLEIAPGIFLSGVSEVATLLKENELFAEGASEVGKIIKLVREAGYDCDRISFDQSIVRGLEYYTGPVYEIAQSSGPFLAERGEMDGEPVRFGSVGGGGRYDGLVSRFKGAEVPATGFSIGVSRLYAALKHLGKIETGAAHGPVVVLVMDRERTGDYARMTQELRNALLDPADPDGPRIRAEMYVGTAGMRAQMKYADKRAAPCVVIQGEDERARGEVQIKDLIEGAKLSEQIEDNVSWREGRPAQFSVPETEMIEAVRSVLARYS